MPSQSGGIRRRKEIKEAAEERKKKAARHGGLSVAQGSPKGETFTTNAPSHCSFSVAVWRKLLNVTSSSSQQRYIYVIITVFRSDILRVSDITTKESQ